MVLGKGMVRGACGASGWMMQLGAPGGAGGPGWLGKVEVHVQRKLMLLKGEAASR